MLNLFSKDRNKVKYVVRGKPGTFNVTYHCGNTTQQFNDVKSGWKYAFEPCKSGYYYVSAQANTKEAVVNVRVYKKGKLVKNVSNSGDYVVALASSTNE